MHDATKSCMHKRTKVQDTPMNLSLDRVKKFTDMISESTLQLVFKKLLFVKFWCSAKKNIHNYLKKAIKMLRSFQPHILV